jgi:phosphoribosylanthranilate isomerase
MLAKVCGLTNPGDAGFAAAAGADLLGFVMHPPSPRHCADPGSAAKGHEDKAVLVTVGQDAAAMMALGQLMGIRRLQPHVPASHRGEVVSLLRAQGFWILLPWADEPDQPRIEADLYLWEPSPRQTGVAGGSGQTHPMRFPPPGPFLLAGGLEAANLQERFAAIPAEVRPQARGADAASRLERLPGLKDPQKVREFIIELKKIKDIETADSADYADG